MTLISRFVEHLLSTYYLAGIVLPSGNARVNEICFQPSKSSLLLVSADAQDIVRKQFSDTEE